MALVADGEAPELVDPGKGALDHPAVLAEMLGAVDAAAGDAGRDGALTQVFAATVEVVALVGVELLGRLRGRPRDCRIGWIASTTVVSAMLSCRLAPVRTTARGRPLRSTMMCRLVPGLPRSVGFGPIASPPFWPAPRKHPRSRETSRSRRQD